MDSGQGFCVCLNCRNSMEEPCQTTKRANDHCRDVGVLLFDDPSMMTILVGEFKVKMTCHKIILNFYSEFFRFCYGGFLESTKGVITMPEDDPTAVVAFSTWCYTGKIYTSASLESIWILGDKLHSILFMNEAMYSMFNYYGHELSDWISATHAELVYEEITNLSSPLCGFVRSLIAAHPPLSKAALQKYEGMGYQQAWEELLAKGGPHVLDVFSLMDDR